MDKFAETGSLQQAIRACSEQCGYTLPLEWLSSKEPAVEFVRCSSCELLIRQDAHSHDLFVVAAPKGKFCYTGRTNSIIDLTELLYLDAESRDILHQKIHKISWLTKDSSWQAHEDAVTKSLEMIWEYWQTPPAPPDIHDEYNWGPWKAFYFLHVAQQHKALHKLITWVNGAGNVRFSECTGIPMAWGHLPMIESIDANKPSTQPLYRLVTRQVPPTTQDEILKGINPENTAVHTLDQGNAARIARALVSILPSSTQLAINGDADDFWRERGHLFRA